MTQENLTIYKGMADDFKSLCLNILYILTHAGLTRYQHTTDSFVLNNDLNTVTCTGYYLGKKYVQDFPAELLFKNDSELSAWAKTMKDGIDESKLTHDELVEVKKITIRRKK